MCIRDRVHEWPDMETPRRCVAVESRLEPVPRQQLGQPSRVVAEPNGIDRGVLDERHGSLASFARGAEQSEPRLPQLPEPVELVAGLCAKPVSYTHLRAHE